MELPSLVPIEYRGELVAVVSSRRIHILAPWLLARAAGDPELRLVGYMCACCLEILSGRLDATFTSEFTEAWARRAIAHEVPRSPVSLPVPH